MSSLAARIALFLLSLPALAGAADLGVNGTTLVSFEQRSTPGFERQRVIPATQFLGIDADHLGNPNLSLHLYGWGRVDLADRSTDEKYTDGDLTYGYLRYLFPTANGEVKAGRFFVFDGVSAEHVDGVSARADLARGFALSMYGGAPVRLDRADDNKGDVIIGGRVSYRIPSLFELGFSALHEKGVTNGQTTDLKDHRQLVGGDLWLRPHKTTEFSGRISYNTATDGVAEQSYLLTVRPSAPLSVAGEYSRYRIKDYFAATNIRSLFNPDTGDNVQYYGGSVTYVIAKPAEVTVSYRHYNRDITGNSDRFGGEGRLTLLDNKCRAGLSYFRTEAPTGINSYHEIRGYLLHTAAKYTASVDTIAHLYDDKIFGKNTAFEVQGSAGYRLRPNLKLSGDLSYGQNPQFNDELKGLVRLTFNYDFIKGAGK
ncbi:MAG: hypothetical protein FD174_3897 [Geobacteraceae bacterium]|nr:MAG: hypothetical protein FD174_3897 [Geobacteraceae bacterium]